MLELVPKLLALLTIFANFLTIGLLIHFFNPKIFKNFWGFGFIAKNKLFLALVVATTAMLGSLFYSEVLKYEPCVLCWYQRILMYSQVPILLFAWGKKDLHVIPYSLILSSIGVVIATYHYFIQITPTESVVCSVVGYSSSCTQTFNMQFGYITIPMMALSAFLLIVVILNTKDEA